MFLQSSRLWYSCRFTCDCLRWDRCQPLLAQLDPTNKHTKAQSPHIDAHVKWFWDGELYADFIDVHYSYRLSKNRLWLVFLVKLLRMQSETVLWRLAQKWLEVWKRSSRHHFLIVHVSKWRHGLDFNLQSPYLLLLNNNTWQKLLVQLLSHKCRPITLTERRDWSKQGDDGHYTAGKRSCRRSFVFWESRSGNWKSRWLRFEWSK